MGARRGCFFLEDVQMYGVNEKSVRNDADAQFQEIYFSLGFR